MLSTVALESRKTAEIIPLPERRASGEGTTVRCIPVFEPGALIFIGAASNLRGEDNAGFEFALQWDIPPRHGVWALGETATLRTLAEAGRRGLIVGGATAVALHRHCEEMARRRGLDRIAIFLQVLALLAAAPAGDVRALAEEALKEGRGVRHDAMARAVHHIHANYREAISLTELLKLTHTSRASFCRQFRQHTGRTFSDFLNYVRLEAVCRDLRDTTDRVGDIAFAHGFNQLSFFNRLFRREMGQNPSRYRALHRAAMFASGMRMTLAG